MKSQATFKRRTAGLKVSTAIRVGAVYAPATEPIQPTRWAREGAALLDDVRAFVAVLNDRYQDWIGVHIDPLFRRSPQEQQGKQTRPLIPAQKTVSGKQYLYLKTSEESVVNRTLRLSVVAAGIVVIGKLTFPPLQWAALPLFLYGFKQVFERVYTNLIVEHRLTAAVPTAIVFGGLVLTGNLALGVLMFILSALGDKLYLLTRSQSENRIITLLGQQPKEVAVLVDGQEVMIPFEEVAAGALVVVYAGEMIPADGVVVSGEATVDQQSLTGEAQPAEKMAGAEVLTATTVITGKLVIRVERPGNESVATQITEVLNQTASYQTTIESWSVTVVDRAVPIRMLLGALALPVAGVTGSLSVLMASFGNAMRAMGPLTVLNFLNIASNKQILIKDGRSLELLPKINSVVFDKTGTLTIEQPHVAAVHTLNGFQAEQILAYAASSEYKQSHPIARAIIEHAQAQHVPLSVPDETTSAVGFGIRTQISGVPLLVGSERFMASERVAIPDEFHPIQNATLQQGHSLVYVAARQQLVGAIELHSTVRDEVPAIVQELRRKGITTYIISGDHEAPTRTLAHAIGVDHYYAETLPADKARIVDELQAAGHSVCFVGDGINDGIALRKAHVSVSLRGATTMATDAAQIVMMDQSLAQLVRLFDLSREFDLNMKVNYAFAIVPSIILVSGVFLNTIAISGAVLLGMSSMYLGMANTFVPLLKYRLKPKFVVDREVPPLAAQ